jgi:4-amino-4-deoxy-L-arabinose transferase-like glycosyltransferase
MLPIQEIIHKFEEGEGVRIVKLAAIFLALIALAAIYNLREFKNFSAPDAMDMSQVARNISEGRGFVTDCVRPRVLGLLEEHQGGNPNVLKTAVPDLTYPPVYPYLLAGWMKIIPMQWVVPQKEQLIRYQPEFYIGLFNQLWFFLAAWMLFRLSRRLFDSSVAWFSAILFIGSDLYWQFSISGLPTMMLMVLVLALVEFLTRIESDARGEQHRSTGWYAGMTIGAGLTIGLAAMTQYSMFWLLAPALLFLAFFAGKQRALTLPLVLLACALVMTPWLARNYQVSGTFFGTAGYAMDQGGTNLQGTVIERSLKLDEALLSGNLMEDGLRKLLVNARHIIQVELPTMSGGWVAAFFLVGLMMPFKNAGLARLRYFILATIGVFVMVQALTQTWLTDGASGVRSENLLVLFGPLVIMYGAGLFFVLLDSLELPFPAARTWIASLAGIIFCAPMVFALLPPRTYPISYPPYYPWLIQKTAGYLKTDELMMSDMPWAVAWYGRRECVWLTMNVKPDFFTINDFQKPVKGIYFTHLTLDERFLSRLVKGDDRSWGRFVLESLLKGNVPVGFPLRNAWSDVLPDQVFLSDWERWRNTDR